MLKISRQPQKGFSLVEVMVGLTVGLVVLMAASSIYLSAVNSRNDSVQLVRLNQTVRSIMDIMAFDLHRAGYWGGASSGVGNNPFTVHTSGTGTGLTDIMVSTDGSCILYTYDTDRDGIVDSDEYFGFRFNSATNAVETVDQTGVSPLADTAAIGDCSALSWQPLNISSEVQVTGLSFSTEGSQCLAFDPTTYNSASAATYSNWALASGSTTAACDTANQPGGLSASFTARSEIRKINITLTARHAQDSLLTRTLTESIRIRNDRVAGI